MRVAIVTANLAHYRRHLYRILDEAPSVEIVHYSGDSRETDIMAIEPSQLKNLVTLQISEFLGIRWQHGVVSMALYGGHDAYIFTGDAHFASTWIASCILKFKKKPVYFWTIGWHRPESGLRRYVRSTFYRLADKLLLYSNSGKQLAIDLGYPQHRMAVIYNSVTDVDQIDVKEIASQKDVSTVGAIARINSAKNFEQLIEAASILNAQGNTVKVVFGGEGPERNILKEKADRLGVYCEFIGGLHEDAEIQRFYERVSVTVVPSASGLTTIQSLAHGVPVITDDNNSTQGPEVDAIHPGTTGSRFEANNAEALANEIRTWLGHVEADAFAVAKQCQNEVLQRWSPSMQASLMLKAIGASGTSE